MRDEAIDDRRAAELHSARLSYRPLGHSDAARIATLAGEWDIARMTSRIPHPYTLIDADLWIASIGNDEFVRGVEHVHHDWANAPHLANEINRDRICVWRRVGVPTHLSGISPLGWVIIEDR